MSPAIFLLQIAELSVAAISAACSFWELMGLKSLPV